MATVKFRLRNNLTDNASISVYLTVKRGKQFLISTGLSIDPNNWKTENKSKSLTGLPKNMNDENIKNLKTDLKKLETHLLNETNHANANGININSNWVKEQINACFERQSDNEVNKEIKSVELNKLTTQTQLFIDGASTYIKNDHSVGLSKTRVKTLKNFKTIIEGFEKDNKSIVYLKDIDFDFEKKFNDWLLNKKEFSINYGGSIIRDLKVICQYAMKKKGVEVNKDFKFIKKYKQRHTDKIIQTLSKEELNIIEEWKTDSERLDNARKWLIIGCNIGQRGSDLLNITLKNFVTINEKKYIEITQLKGSKNVLIPITKQCERILKTGIPYKISSQKLNLYIKEVCELAKIDQVVEGDIYDKKNNRKIRGFYPKYKLITTHSFRRSFASNYYIDIPTPVLMEITGHTKEVTFRLYINKPVDKTRNANLMLELIELAELKKGTQKETKVIEMNKAN
jgi:integrase